MFDHYILLLHLENSSTEHTTNQSMSIADFSKPYLIEVDSSANTVGAALLQSVEGQGNRPIAFASHGCGLMLNVVCGGLLLWGR